MMCTLQVPFAVVESSVHRLCSVVYHTKPFFKKKRWAVMCLVCQWSSGVIAALPRLSFNDPTCGRQFWRRIYALIIVVVIPSLICAINNIIIFTYVRSSTTRVQPLSGEVKNNHHQHINRRDLHLLRHMIVMFCIFVGGWTPVYLYTAVVYDIVFTSTTVSLVILLAELSVFIDIINLYLYNHELRRYFLDKICRRP